MTNTTEALIDMLLLASRTWGSHQREMLVPMLYQERGPGIDTRPDNSIAHLPEDLLCDDA